MPTRRLASAAFAACVPIVTSTAQNFVNGDFEQNTFAVACAFNETNATFNANMPGCVAYGPGGSISQNGEIDVMGGACTSYGPVGPIGTTRLGLAGNNQTGGVDALTLELTSPLVVGTAYTVSFWGHSVVAGLTVGAGRIEIGTSSLAGNTGTVVGTSALLDTATWSFQQVRFTATAPHSFLSVATQQQNYRTWNWVDGFQIHQDQSAWCAPANGNGVNVTACTCLAPPVLGSVWLLDLAPTPNTLMTAAFVSLESLAPVALPFGEVLIASPVVALDGNFLHVAGIPPLPLLAGTPLFAQGVLVENAPGGLDLVLTNAMVGVIGL